MGRRAAAKNNKEICRTTAFFVPREAISGDLVVFPPDEEHHLRDVLRLKSGAVVEVLDGCGGRYRVVVEQGPRGSDLVGRVLGVERVEAVKPLISVALSLGRRERIRMAVEKLAELGCHRIVPLLADNSSFQGNPGRQVEKLSLVCRSALKQSGNCFLTAVEPAAAFGDFAAEAVGRGIPLSFCVKDTGRSRRKNDPGRPTAGGDEYFLVIGPEGGFSSGEQALIDEMQAPRLHLGAADLRLETAAVAGFILMRELLRRDLYFY
ncbi:MAG: 16S rRNA (uracil(1498)-N(3))-methyltransferase [Candidatus Glassbacteria bacterium]|nr:16S rRNA (uracil(1498)-N(3))-methyltransferase [Candidatus Glassbacteria bacterium]